MVCRAALVWIALEPLSGCGSAPLGTEAATAVLAAARAPMPTSVTIRVGTDPSAIATRDPADRTAVDGLGTGRTDHWGVASVYGSPQVDGHWEEDRANFVAFHDGLKRLGVVGDGGSGVAHLQVGMTGWGRDEYHYLVVPLSDGFRWEKSSLDLVVCTITWGPQRATDVAMLGDDAATVKTQRTATVAPTVPGLPEFVGQYTAVAAFADPRREGSWPHWNDGFAKAHQACTSTPAPQEATVHMRRWESGWKTE